MSETGEAEAHGRKTAEGLLVCIDSITFDPISGELRASRCADSLLSRRSMDHWSIHTCLRRIGIVRQVFVLSNINGQKASLKIGERVPVATGSFQSGISGLSVSGLVNTQFQYIDVGVKSS